MHFRPWFHMVIVNMIGNRISAPSKIRDHLQWLSTSITKERRIWHWYIMMTQREKAKFTQLFGNRDPKKASQRFTYRTSAHSCHCIKMLFVYVWDRSCRGASDNNLSSRISEDGYALVDTNMSGMPSDTPRPKRRENSLGVTRYGTNHEEKCTVTNTLIVAWALRLWTMTFDSTVVT